MDTEAHPDLAQQYQIRSIPNVKLFVDGEVASEFAGALPEQAVLQWLDKALPGKHRKTISQAQRLLAEGNLAKAQSLLQGVIAAEPDNQQAKVLLAKSLLYSKPKKALDLVRDIHEDSEFFDLVDTVRIFGRLFHFSDEPEALPDSPVKAHYLAAINYLRSENFDQALENFIDIIQNDRYYDDDGSRKACIAIFKFLGEGNELTRKHRPAFSSALYI